MKFLIFAIIGLIGCVTHGLAASEDDKCFNREEQEFCQPTKPRGEHTLQYTKAVIQKPAPIFEGTAVVNGEFKQLSLKDYRGKYVVFFFYPLDFTFVCPTEILAFSERIAEFRNINTEVIACSVDSHFTHLAWTKTPRKEGGLGKVSFSVVFTFELFSYRRSLILD